MQEEKENEVKGRLLIEVQVAELQGAHRTVEESKVRMKIFSELMANVISVS